MEKLEGDSRRAMLQAHVALKEKADALLKEVGANEALGLRTGDLVHNAEEVVKDAWNCDLSSVLSGMVVLGEIDATLYEVSRGQGLGSTLSLEEFIRRKATLLAKTNELLAMTNELVKDALVAACQCRGTPPSEMQVGETKTTL